jgi:hypothetical protein
VSKSYVLERSKHMVSTWQVTELTDPPGLLAERTFSMRPVADSGLKCAHQTFINPSMCECRASSQVLACRGSL